MNLSKQTTSRAKNPAKAKKKDKKDKMPTLDEFVATRNYMGAITLLEVLSGSGTHVTTTPKDVYKESKPIEQWLGYCYFHLGDYEKALEHYENAQKVEKNLLTNLAVACCNLYLGRVAEAQALIKQSPPCQLKERLKYFVAIRNDKPPPTLNTRPEGNDVAALNSLHNSLCEAASLYVKEKFNDALIIYDGLIKDYPDFHAIKVYHAMCNYKLRFYEEAQAMAEAYLKEDPRSSIALNLYASILHCRAPQHQQPLEILKQVERASFTSPSMRSIIAHNKVIFKNGEGALQVLPPLLNELREAKVNLTMYYLFNDLLPDAAAQMRDHEPRCLSESKVKAVVCTLLAQSPATGAAVAARIMGGGAARVDEMAVAEENLTIAAHQFEIVGQDPDERDTIPGRQAMASSLFLQGKFGESLKYFDSIEEFSTNDDVFALNYGIALAMCQKYEKAEKMLLRVVDERIRRENENYIQWLVRCRCMTGKPQLAYDIFLQKQEEKDRMEGGEEDGAGSPSVSALNSQLFTLLQIISTDCFQTGHFYFAAKAYEQLQQMEPGVAEFGEGLRASCAGVFYQLSTGKTTLTEQKKEELREVIQILRADEKDETSMQWSITMMKWLNEKGGMGMMGGPGVGMGGAMRGSSREAARGHSREAPRQSSRGSGSRGNSGAGSRGMMQSDEGDSDDMHKDEMDGDWMGGSSSMMGGEEDDDEFNM
ncbi:putative tetratricopeptide repeat protein 26 [Monocercomonoides exilis]|uniref:putative tetratricopeptide repeat protein 26 n=1 Tax=Monocercomonoides exilis TaxID=2049356 RepID=UPI003559553E|nr:putative tetratricopeptide repeat protein 26 [Monocercomonoides exilis]|eukprot:MONOS_10318.1-p1 / transcript=MONOS_10318.1 / gene=MONOS_10318 / organism=Monocercomonoides_exilis_PA203 / gene_product=tetratricopeptide repeat protein 26 / transcript_product=tetratricopeptide repeat protein 26 / location=Mono_scaffold00464:18833-21211(+) / protein_length=707 / sequence_SO=supercontig / SO=protein_coding / is_pseudo=false